MKIKKRNFAKRVAGVILCRVISLILLGGYTIEVKSIDNSQIVNSVSVSENKKTSEQLYRTKTGKCYHKEGCQYLKKSKIKINEEEIKEADLESCSKCCK